MALSEDSDRAIYQDFVGGGGIGGGGPNRTLTATLELGQVT
jgi:hypothetical protein